MERHVEPVPIEALERARELRRKETTAEAFLWELVRDRRLNGVKFRRQHPWPPFTLDFYAAKVKVAIELDGGQHAETRRQDENRDRILRENRVLTLRFWNHELLNDPERVLEVIWRAVQHG